MTENMALSESRKIRALPAQLRLPAACGTGVLYSKWVVKASGKGSSRASASKSVHLCVASARGAPLVVTALKQAVALPSAEHIHADLHLDAE